MDFFEGLARYEGPLVEDGNTANAAAVAAGGRKNILDKSTPAAGMSSHSSNIRDKVLPQHLRNNFRTVVCRHWLNAQCMKGDSCEFLHQMVLDAMPECRDGMKCPKRLNGSCLLKHVEVDLNCHFYTHGFCKNGRNCDAEHHPKPITELPFIGRFDLGIKYTRKPVRGPQWFALDEEIIERRKAGPNGMYKTSACKDCLSESRTGSSLL